MAEALFWIPFAVLAWVAVGFPLTAAVWGLLRRRAVQRADVTPTASIIIAAHDEERCIARKLRNCLDLGYPADRLEIIVASDGSTDRTEAIAREFSSEQVQVLSLPRRGKVHALDEAVRASRGEILVFTDANTILDEGALRFLASNFADPEVGAVCGNQRVRTEGIEDSVARGERVYWGYDKQLKTLESATGSIVSADGALYAVRRDLYRRPAPELNDDFAISTKVIELGKRLVYDRRALAWESAAASSGHEFERKVRIVSKGLWSVLAARSLLNPLRHGFYSIVLFTHKVLRRLTPICMLGILAGSALLAPRHPLWATVFAAQILFYSLAAVGALTRRSALGKIRVLSAPFFFCLANLAALIGLALVIAGRRIELWQPRRQDATT